MQILRMIGNGRVNRQFFFKALYSLSFLY